MKSRISREEAADRIEIDEYTQMAGKFLVRYGDPAEGDTEAGVWLVEGCKCTIQEVAHILSEQFPATSHVEVRDDPWLDVKHIDLEWSEMQYEWDHHTEFHRRVIKTLELLSLS